MQEANSQIDEKEQLEQKSQNIQFDDYPAPKLGPTVIIKSAHVDQYHNFFSKFPKEENLKSRLIEQLQRHNIFFLANQHQHVYQISTSNHSLTYEAVRLSVRITNFILQIAILNVKGSSSTHNLQNLSQTKASIYQCSSKKNTILKCISFPQVSFKDQITMAIKEYSILKIASILGVGPKMNNIFGFDLVVYDECIEFCMEECTMLESIDSKQSEDLIRKLQILHELQIVHLDIKPQNICFSPERQEMVFIDFGFSDVLAQRLGELTQTTFFGTLGYCSPEMMSCYDSHGLIMMDLYYNDVWSLNKSFSEILQKSNDHPNIAEENGPKDGYFNDQNKKLQEKVGGLFDLFFIKHALFTSSDSIFKSPLFVRKLHRFKSQIILFSKELFFSHFISDLLSYFKMNFADELFLREQYQRKNSELNKLLNYGRKVKSIEGQLTQKYASFSKGISIDQPNQVRSKLRQDFNLKELILSRKLSQQINIETYYENFVQFTNFTIALSTFNEKIQACKFLLSITGWSVQQNQEEISFLGCCYKLLLNYYIETAPENCIKTIPILLCNLVIIEEVTEAQLLNLLKKAVTLQFSSNFHFAIFLMRCSLLKLWTKQRTMTKDLIIIMNYQFQLIVLDQFNKIKHQGGKFSELILIIQKLVRIFYDEKISLSPKEYEQTKAIIQSSLLLDAQLKIQINLFFFTIMLKFNTKNVDSTNSMCFIQQIILQQSYRKEKCQYFEYYHFVIFHFYQRTCNYKVLTHLIDNMNACFGNAKISERYSIYIYYTCMKYYQIERGPQFLSFILNRLKSNSAEKQGELLFYTVLVIFHEQSELSLKNDARDILNKIFEVLREKFPLQRQTIVDINRNYIGNIYEMGYYLGVIVERVHRDNPIITDYLLDIRQFLQSLVKNIPCLYCKERAITYIFTLEGFILWVKKKTEDIIKLYRHILSDFKYQVLPSGFIMVAAEKILYYAVHEKSIYCEALVEPMYRWMKEKNSWKDLFIILPKNSITYINLNNYIIRTQNYAQFFEIQFKLISFLPIYPSKQYTVAYARGLCATLSNASEQNRKGLMKQYRQGNYLKVKDSAYQIIVAVYMLQIWPKDDHFTENILKFVVNGINYVSNMARLVTKQKIYGHLIIAPPNNMEKNAQKRSRFIQYIFKQSLKYEPRQIDFRLFKYCFCIYPLLKLSSQKTKTKSLVKCIRNYYNNLDFGVSYFSAQFMVKNHFTS